MCTFLWFVRVWAACDASIHVLLQGFGNRQTTLYDIRDELFGMYRERRLPFRGLTGEERFRLLTGETRHTLAEGRLVMGSVAGITRRKPTRDMLDQANPEHSEETGLWRCPFCLRDAFSDLSEVGLKSCKILLSVQCSFFHSFFL